MLDVHLALFRGENIVVLLGIHEALQAAPLCETIRHALPILLHLPGKIHCSADVQRAVTPVRHDVDPSAHGASGLP
jgi:hypothetical protein